MRYSSYSLIFIMLLLLISAAFLLGPAPYTNAAEGGYRGIADGETSEQGAQSRQGAVSEQGAQSKQSPSNYLSDLYIWFLGFVGIAAMFAIVMGGVMYMFAGANLTKTEQAKKWITNAIWGIVLAAVSVLLLRTINPDLVRGFNLETVVSNAIQKIK